MLVGWEAPNTPEISEAAWALFAAAKCNLLKTRLYHPFSVYERALQINPATEFLLRPTDEGRLNAREQFEKAQPRIAELRAHGVKLRFITWSEPNHPDGRYGGPDSVEGAWQFIAELELFVLLLRDAFPDLLLVSPPLAVPWNEPLWDEVCDRTFRSHNYLGRHIYWQGANELSPDWGLRLLAARERFPHMRCVVAEIGDSSNDGKPESEWVPATIRYSRIVRCLEELQRLGWVDAAAIFILPGTPEWRGFWPDIEAARAMGALILSSGDNDGGVGIMDKHEAILDNIWDRQGIEANPAITFYQYALRALREQGRIIAPLSSRDGNYYVQVGYYYICYTNPLLWAPVSNPAEVHEGLPPF